MLKQITDLVTTHSPLSLKDLSVMMQTPLEALEPMIDFLERKGRINITKTGCDLGHCPSCSCLSRCDMIVLELPKKSS